MLTHSPRIVTDGLQICLDWGNPKCYSGTGSTFLNVSNSSRNNGFLKNNVTYNSDNGGYLTTNGSNGAGGTNAVGDRIDINTSQSGIDRFTGTHNFSVFFWNYLFGSASRIWSTGSAGAGTENNDQCIWQMYITNNDFFWWNENGGGDGAMSCSFNNTRIFQTWQYVGITYTHNEAGNNVTRTFVNGQQVGITQLSTSVHRYRDRSNESILQWTLGGGYSSSCNTVNTLNRFGPFHMYNKSLSATEIVQNYNAMRGRFGL